MRNLMQMRPIGYLRSVFQFKNGTPRQPSLCSAARGSMTVDKSIFNNPEHALEGLEQFSHAWIVFVFHKNQCGHTKAKVKPPRLNGKRVGVFSTRSPYRPNAIGLTLAKIERISGATVHLSGIDIVDGTPVLDIKPFIPQYDVPECRGESVVEDCQCASSDKTLAVSAGAGPMVSNTADAESMPFEQQSSTFCQESSGPPTNSNKVETSAETTAYNERCASTAANIYDGESEDSIKGEITKDQGYAEVSSVASPEVFRIQDSHTEGPLLLECSRATGDNNAMISTGGEHKRRLHSMTIHQGYSEKGEKSSGVFRAKETFSNAEDEQTSSVSLSQAQITVGDSSSSNTTVAEWLSAPPVSKLRVSFTPTAEAQLQKFKTENSSDTDDEYQLKFLSGMEDVRTAVVSVLAEDPRSVYRREKCCDSLYFFTVDQVHVTCWFDDRENHVEVVRLQPVSRVDKLLVKM
ncbi:tRNA (adenine(37)-N6)-methyltransferase-like isoform X2 [Babylonia areolata]|uniref:tRNA (adenine(37)-N6)-methyltransferase-like isoform X2 n=1 Tax=Babylonia areolata TaxID=304850 RepID=UPI003FD6A306